MNWLLLSDAWLGAKETRRALMALERALTKESTAELHLRHAKLAAELGDWDQVVRSAEVAARLSEPPELGESHLLAGRAYYQLSNYHEALAEFNRAAAYPPVRDRAEQWLTLTQYQTRSEDISGLDAVVANEELDDG